MTTSFRRLASVSLVSAFVGLAGSSASAMTQSTDCPPAPFWHPAPEVVPEEGPSVVVFGTGVTRIAVPATREVIGSGAFRSETGSAWMVLEFDSSSSAIRRDIFWLTEQDHPYRKISLTLSSRWGRYETQYGEHLSPNIVVITGDRSERISRRQAMTSWDRVDTPPSQQFGFSWAYLSDFREMRRAENLLGRFRETGQLIMRAYAPEDRAMRRLLAEAVFQYSDLEDALAIARAGFPGCGPA